MSAEMSPQDPLGGWRSAVEAAQKIVRDRGHPVLAKPTLNLDEITFPEEVEALTGVQLANITIRHQGWFSYMTVQLAGIRAECTVLDELFGTNLGYVMNEIRSTFDGKPTKDVLRSMAITQNAELRHWVRKKVELDQVATLIEGTVAGLAIRCRALESEAIRRAVVQRIEGGR